MRLDKYIAHNAGLSRKDATLAIKKRRVMVDGVIAKSPALQVESENVTLNGDTLQQAKAIYWMLHKPQGFVSANNDGEHPTVFDLIDLSSVHPSLREQLQIAGRLDIDTTGLVLITSDGQWNHAITSPKKQQGKRYRVQLAEPLTTEAIQDIEKGILLRNEDTACKPAKLTTINENNCLLEITEGKYHQVKRMFAATGNRVVGLHREAIAGIELDSTLAEGEHRPLTQDEINTIG